MRDIWDSGGNIIEGYNHGPSESVQQTSLKSSSIIYFEINLQ